MAAGNILAVVDPVDRRIGAAVRGDWLASRSGARLRLLATVHHALFARDLFHLSDDLERQRGELVAEASGWLAEVAGGLQSEAEIEAAWDHPFDRGVLSAVERHRPDLVIVAPRDPGSPSRAEWRLIKHCPVPLWLVKGGEWPPTPSVLGCVDPTHSHDKPADLDRLILEWSERVAAAGGTAPQLLHACGMTPHLSGSEPYTHQFRDRQDGERYREIQAMLPDPEAAAVEIQFIHSEPVEAVRAFVRERGTDLAVMGSMSRSWLNEKLIGSASRQLVPDLDCDLLLVPFNA